VSPSTSSQHKKIWDENEQNNIQMHKGSSFLWCSESWSSLRISKEQSSLSSGSSRRSCSGDLVKLTGDSGVVPKEEFEFCHNPWLRLENVGVTGVEEVEAPEDSRDDSNWYGEPKPAITSSCFFDEPILGMENERILLML
jgi:hypothetical protein